MKTVLRDLTKDLIAVADLAVDEDLPPEALRDTLDAIEGEFKTKAISIANVDAEFDASIAALKTEIDRLTAKKRIVENAKDRLRDYLRENMEAAQISKISCPLFTITCAKGRAIAEVHDVGKVPDEYVETKLITQPKKADILKALKDGIDVPGCSLGMSKSSIRIK
jgi:uncharacterized small protein (DUF1192 family)